MKAVTLNYLAEFHARIQDESYLGFLDMMLEAGWEEGAKRILREV